MRREKFTRKVFKSVRSITRSRLRTRIMPLSWPTGEYFKSRFFLKNSVLWFFFSNYSLALYFFGSRIYAKKLLVKLLVKLITGGFYTNILRATFWIKVSCAAFTCSGFVFLKVYCKMLVKLTTGGYQTRLRGHTNNTRHSWVGC